MFLYARYADRLVVIGRGATGVWTSKSTHRGEHWHLYRRKETVADLRDWFRAEHDDISFVSREAARDHLIESYGRGELSDSLVAGDPMLPDEQLAENALRFMESPKL